MEIDGRVSEFRFYFLRISYPTPSSATFRGRKITSRPSGYIDLAEMHGQIRTKSIEAELRKIKTEFTNPAVYSIETELKFPWKRPCCRSPKDPGPV